MVVNGTKLPVALFIPILIFTFWLGGLSWTVVSNAENLKEHAAKPAHEEAALMTNTVQADVRHNKEEIQEVKEALKEMKRQMSKDKEEILNAIREAE